nr:MAG TPA: hypothetical protein [Caudoviricetes sp.]
MFYPQNVLHLPPPRVNSDNVVTSSVNINAEHYRWLLFLISGKLKRVLIDYLACGYIF